MIEKPQNLIRTSYRTRFRLLDLCSVRFADPRVRTSASSLSVHGPFRRAAHWRLLALLSWFGDLWFPVGVVLLAWFWLVAASQQSPPAIIRHHYQLRTVIWGPLAAHATVVEPSLFSPTVDLRAPWRPSEQMRTTVHGPVQRDVFSVASLQKAVEWEIGSVEQLKQAEENGVWQRVAKAKAKENVLHLEAGIIILPMARE